MMSIPIIEMLERSGRTRWREDIWNKGFYMDGRSSVHAAPSVYSEIASGIDLKGDLSSDISLILRDFCFHSEALCAGT